nr:MAG TPA: hypothetical protein [Caudoviricetes sp.]
MSKLVDKTKLQKLAQALDTRAKNAVEAEQTRATGVEQGLQTSINAINNETTGILAKAKEYADGLNGTSNGEIEKLKTKDTELQNAIEAEATARTNAINKLNGTAETEGSVAKSIKDALDPVKADVSKNKANITANSEALTTEEARAKAAEQANATAIAKLNGLDTVEGSVAKSIKDALDPVKANVTTNGESITALQGKVTANTKAITDGDVATLTSAKKYADKAISDLIDSAPEDRNTLNKLSEAIKANKDVYDGYVTTVNAQLAKKVDKVEGSRLITEDEAKKFAAKAETSDVSDALASAKQFTTDEVAKVNSANNAVTQRVTKLEGVVGKAAEGENAATGLVKNVADLQAKNKTQDTAIEGAQSTADNAVAAAAAAQKQADKGVADAAAAKKQADKGVADAAAAQTDVDALKAQLGTGGTSGLSKDIKANTDAIAAINNAETGILATSKKYTDEKIGDLTTTVNANKKAISTEEARAKAAEKVNADAIAKLNGTAETDGSVAKSIADALADYTDTTNMKAFVASVVNTLALTMEDDKVKLKLGGVDGVTVTETSLDLCTDADITEIITSLDAPATA